MGCGGELGAVCVIRASERALKNKAQVEGQGGREPDVEKQRPRSKISKARGHGGGLGLGVVEGVDQRTWWVLTVAVLTGGCPCRGCVCVQGGVIGGWLWDRWIGWIEARLSGSGSGGGGSLWR
jgi:hypothetical protein